MSNTQDSETGTDVTITHHTQGQGGVYIAHVEGSDHQGRLEWEPRDGPEGDVRVATHTIVPEAIGGRGIAAQLVQRLVGDAREQGFTIVPQCSYVAAKFDDNPEWSDLRAK